MAENVYECMFIFDSNAYARDPHGVSGRVEKIIQQCGGQMLASRLWFEQKLAYPIDGHRKGTYWLAFFRMEGNQVADFNRQCQLEDNIVRNLTLKVDPRTVELRVSQASGLSAVTEESPAAVGEPTAPPATPEAVREAGSQTPAE